MIKKLYKIIMEAETKEEIVEMIKGEKIILIEEIKGKRTLKQNRALHLYFTLLANALNDAGFDMKKTIREDIDIRWSGKMVKELLWRPIQKVHLRKHSTTRLKKDDIDKIYDILNKAIGERTGVFVEFPNEDYLIEYK